MAEQNGGVGAVLVGFVLGAVTGAALALLVAPAPGEDTRRYLGDRAREGAGKASDTARQIGERVREGREKAVTAVQQGKEFVARQRETITTAVERGREAYREAHEKEQA